MERKQIIGYRRILTVAFSLILAPVRPISQPCVAIINIKATVKIRQNPLISFHDPKTFTRIIILIKNENL